MIHIYIYCDGFIVFHNPDCGLTMLLALVQATYIWSELRLFQCVLVYMCNPHSILLSFLMHVHIDIPAPLWFRFNQHVRGILFLQWFHIWISSDSTITDYIILCFPWDQHIYEPLLLFFYFNMRVSQLTFIFNSYVYLFKFNYGSIFN